LRKEEETIQDARNKPQFDDYSYLKNKKPPVNKAVIKEMLFG